VGANNNQVSTFKCVRPLVFKALSIKCAFFWHFVFWIILFRCKPANRKSVFIELRSFKSLFVKFVVNFQVSTWNERHHMLVKLSCESIYENLDPISARYAVCFFQPKLQLSKESSWPSLWLHFLYLHASYVHQHTFNRSQVATLLWDTDSRSRSTKITPM